MLPNVQLREIFHFLFLKELLRRSDPKLYVLKGGVNLRFFFGSPRYSEDMDLDVRIAAVNTLKKNGFKILNDRVFLLGLSTYGVEKVEVRDPQKLKQTETTQRFKAQLIRSSGETLSTRIEFSRRLRSPGSPDTDIQIDRIDPAIASRFQQLPYRCQHYSGPAMIYQKVEALAGRNQPQCRDVFDLFLLYQKGLLTSLDSKDRLSVQTLKAASQKLSALTFKDFEGQVLEFLDPHDRDEYGSKSVWNEIQKKIDGFLQGKSA